MAADTAEPAAAGFGFGPYQVGPEVQAGLVQLAGKGPKAVQYTEVDGQPVFEGDIVLDLIEAKQVAAEEVVALLESGVIIPGRQFRWPNGLVPFEIDPNLPDQGRVTGAIDHWQRNTRIRFVRRTAQNRAQFPDFIRFVPGSGCSSAVGRRGNVQQITLGSGCELGAAIHEIGHAVGLWHEQSREDRDQFVTVNWANIQQGMAHNFNQHITDGDDVGAYDYHSIMHYPRWAFSNNGQDTIVPRQNVEIGQRQGSAPATASPYGRCTRTWSRRPVSRACSSRGPSLPGRSDGGSRTAGRRTGTSTGRSCRRRPWWTGTRRSSRGSR